MDWGTGVAIVGFALGGGAVSAQIAKQKGRRQWLWFLLAFFTNPIIIVPLLLFMPNLKKDGNDGRI